MAENDPYYLWAATHLRHIVAEQVKDLEHISEVYESMLFSRNCLLACSRHDEHRTPVDNACMLFTDEHLERLDAFSKELELIRALHGQMITTLRDTTSQLAFNRSSIKHHVEAAARERRWFNEAAEELNSITLDQPAAQVGRLVATYNTRLDFYLASYEALMLCLASTLKSYNVPMMALFQQHKQATQLTNQCTKTMGLSLVLFPLTFKGMRALYREKLADKTVAQIIQKYADMSSDFMLEVIPDIFILSPDAQNIVGRHGFALNEENTLIARIRAIRECHLEDTVSFTRTTETEPETSSIRSDEINRSFYSVTTAVTSKIDSESSISLRPEPSVIIEGVFADAQA
ncbi:hypothetical protein GMRT_13851 [Giardia muris]|uniref:Uncharacterized protein n=1 Tax=Giardia muris TaxID=5742 RepID=A0A4Z1SNI5_GIAMU|nr:hypothetical protein GMRT_13851 [Giardia muris]|eukprot:TNJ27342.1 hypothetical protein GMRT_13851 [Giardia muris]